MKYLVFFLILFLTINFSHAQGVVVYEPFNATDSLNPKTDIKIEKNCLKWNLTLMGRGAFAFDFERTIIPTLSFEIETGLTYRDYIYEIRTDDIYLDSDFANDQVSFGYMVGGALKFYPVEGDLEGIFFSPLVRYRTYNIDKAFDLNSNTVYYPNDYNMTEMGFTVGIQAMNWSQIVGELYFGVSYRTTRYLTYNEVYDNNGSLIDYAKQNQMSKAPAFLFGYTIGFAF